MFYVSSRRGDYLGITDTKDSIEEFYTRNQLKTFNIEIIGFNNNLSLGYKYLQRA